MIDYKNIIIVGTNNTGRSFMAEAVFHQLCMEHEMEDVEVISRGTVVLFPEPVHPMAAEVVGEAGYLIKDFWASKLAPEEVEKADLILTITEDEKERVLADFKDELKDREIVFTLSEFAGEHVGIPDPYGKEKEDYETCFVTIKRMAEKCFMAKIRKGKEANV